MVVPRAPCVDKCTAHDCRELRMNLVSQAALQREDGINVAVDMISECCLQKAAAPKQDGIPAPQPPPASIISGHEPHADSRQIPDRQTVMSARG